MIMNTLGHYTLHLRKEHADVFRLQAHAAAWASPVTGTAEHQDNPKCSVEEASCKEILADFPTVIKPQPQSCLLCCCDASSPHIGDPCKAPSLLLQTSWHRWPPKRHQGQPCLAARDQDGQRVVPSAWHLSLMALQGGGPQSITSPAFPGLPVHSANIQISYRDKTPKTQVIWGDLVPGSH